MNHTGHVSCFANRSKITYNVDCYFGYLIDCVNSRVKCDTIHVYNHDGGIFRLDSAGKRYACTFKFLLEPFIIHPIVQETLKHLYLHLSCMH